MYHTHDIMYDTAKLSISMPDDSIKDFGLNATTRVLSLHNSWLKSGTAVICARAQKP